MGNVERLSGADFSQGGNVLLADGEQVLVGGATQAGALAVSAPVTGRGVLTSKVDGDANLRYQQLISGQASYGDGTNAPDVTLYRSAAGVLRTTGQFTADGGVNLPSDPTTALQASTKQYVDSSKFGDVAGGIRFLRRTSNVSVVSSTVLVTAGMSFTVTANGIYEITGLLNVQGAQAGDIKFGFTGPTMSSFSAQITGMGTSTAASEGPFSLLGAASMAGVINRGCGGTSNDMLPVQAFFVVGGTGGTWGLTFAQVTSSTTATIIQAGSYMKCTRLA